MTALPPDALERLLREADFVRVLAQTLLAEEADEVVQQTWLRAVRHGGLHIDAPRSWLARIVRNVVHNVRRRRNRQRRHEAMFTGPGLVPSSAELMQLEEQRRVLLAAIDRLPAELRTIVLLRYFDGHAPRRIAAELGVSSMMVRNRLGRALQLLRERLDAEHGGERRAWLLPLVPFAAGMRDGAVMGAATAAGTTTVTLGLGVLAMTLKAKLAVAVMVLVTLAGAVLLWQHNDGLPAVPPRNVAALDGSVPASADLGGARVAATPAPEPDRREVVAAGAAGATTGSLVVHVRYGDDQTPAAGVTMILFPPDTNGRFGGKREVADASGTARFADLAPGHRVVCCDRGFRKSVAIEAGKVTEFDFELGPGITIGGMVVDAANVPVIGALVEVAYLTLDADAEVLAKTGLDGRFVVRSAPTQALVGARAEGHSASPLQFLIGRKNLYAEVRLQLGAPAGAVEGTVVDRHNMPVAGTVVCIGTGKSCGINPGLDGAPPLPAVVRTDAEGHFRAIGVPIGNQPVFARSAGHAPWQGTCEVAANLTARIHIALSAGATIRGTVRDETGAAVAKASVEIGKGEDFAHFRSGTDANGRFEMVGLPAGALLVEARHRESGRAERHVTTSIDSPIACDFALSRGDELRGRVIDQTGLPVANAWLECRSSAAPGWSSNATSKADGAFAIPNCPAAASFLIDVRGTGIERQRQIPTDLRQSPIELRVRRSRPGALHIQGIVHGPDGRPLPGAVVTAATEYFAESSDMDLTDAEGRFTCGPLVPGTRTILVHAKGFPDWSSEPRELGDGATWDLGTISLVRGGRAVLAIEGNQADLEGLAYDSADNFAAAFESDTDDAAKALSAQLAVGNYRLLLRSKSAAAQSIPFAVREGETTQVHVKLGAGIRQSFEFESTSGFPARALLILRRGGEILASAPVRPRDGHSATGEVCLLPGDYRAFVTVEDRELATALFTVGATEGPPLRIVLE